MLPGWQVTACSRYCLLQNALPGAEGRRQPPRRGGAEPAGAAGDGPSQFQFAQYEMAVKNKPLAKAELDDTEVVTSEVSLKCIVAALC